MKLTLAVKANYFQEIVEKTKRFEYRLASPYWTKRLVGREYRILQITLGYPKRDDSGRRYVVPYRGYELQTIVHPLFGKKPVDVFALHV